MQRKEASTILSQGKSMYKGPHARKDLVLKDLKGAQWNWNLMSSRAGDKSAEIADTDL
jgi:hypothetical protein